jgi:transketolase
VPSFELFFQQEESYRTGVLGTAPVRIAVEAGIRQGWDSIIGSDGLFVGMTGFGASGRIEDLYRHFGITAEAVAAAVEKRLGQG